MKKALFTLALLLGLAAGTYAQTPIPTCTNSSALESRIDAIEHSGWVELSREFWPVYYFAAPEPPFLMGTIAVTFGPDCDPNEPCPKIARLYTADVYVVQDDGTCVIRFNSQNF